MEPSLGDPGEGSSSGPVPSGPIHMVAPVSSAAAAPETQSSAGSGEAITNTNSQISGNAVPTFDSTPATEFPLDDLGEGSSLGPVPGNPIETGTPITLDAGSDNQVEIDIYKLLSSDAITGAENTKPLGGEHRDEEHGNRLGERVAFPDCPSTTGRERDTDTPALGSTATEASPIATPGRDHNPVDDGDSLSLLTYASRRRPVTLPERSPIVSNHEEDSSDSDEDSLFVGDHNRRTTHDQVNGIPIRNHDRPTGARSQAGVDPAIKLEEAVDDDDDLVVVDPKELPEDVKAKFTEKSGKQNFGMHLPDDMPLVCTGSRVKTEAEVEIFSMRQVQKYRDQHADEGNDGDFEADDLDQLSDGENDESPRRRRRAQAPRTQPRVQPRAGPSKGVDSATAMVETVQKRIADMNDELEILKIQRKRLLRQFKFEGLDFSTKENPPVELQEITQKIAALEEKIKTTRKRSLPIMTAREWWQKKYEKHQQVITNFTKRKRMDERSEARASVKRRKKNAAERATAREEENKMKKMRVNDPLRALAIMRDTLTPGAMMLNDRSRLKKQFQTFPMLFPGQDAPDLDEPGLRGLARMKMTSETRGQAKLLQQAKSSFGWAGCMVENKESKAIVADAKWNVRDIDTLLFNHQVLGASWMIGRELSPYGPHGGILSDEMGLGKTLMVLTCMANNPPTKADIAAGRIATLIVVPPAAIAHWAREIENKTELDEACIYKGGNSNIPESKWKTFKIILTTYHAVRADYPGRKTLKKLEEKELTDEVWSEAVSEQIGKLFRIQFHRVVLDEAHLIKNRSGLTSTACARLTSMYRWAITGTPIHNGLVEMYSYLRFIGLERTEEFENYSEIFTKAKKKEKNQQLLQKIAAHVMIQRKSSDLLLGKPILKIPKPYPTIDEWVMMSPEEDIIYRNQERMFRETVNELLEKKNEKGCFFTLLTLIMALRQMTAHLFLGDRLYRRYWGTEEFKKIIDGLEESVHEISPVLLKQLKIYYRQRTRVEAMRPQALNRVARVPKISSVLQSIERSSDDERALLCRFCHDLSEDAHLSRCGHVFCAGCFQQNLDEAMISTGEDHINCPACGSKVRRMHLTPIDLHGVDDDASSQVDVPVVPGHRDAFGKRKRQQKDTREYGDDINLIQPEAEYENMFLELNDKQQELSVTGSTKIDIVMKYIRQWQKEAPDEKIIVFTQWRVFGKILGRKLFDEDIGFLYHFGTMKMEERDKAVLDFQAKKEASVFISGFRCGGVSLNLAFASRVILADLWWNTAMEKQAFARVLRIGQEKRTHFVRVMLTGTIDQRMMAIQTAKKQECDILMEGDNDRKTKHLDLNDLASLFGSLNPGTARVTDDFDRLIEENLLNRRPQIEDDTTDEDSDSGETEWEGSERTKGSGQQDDGESDIDDDSSSGSSFDRESALVGS